MQKRERLTKLTDNQLSVFLGRSETCRHGRARFWTALHDYESIPNAWRQTTCSDRSNFASLLRRAAEKNRLRGKLLVGITEMDVRHYRKNFELPFLSQRERTLISKIIRAVALKKK